MGFLEFCFVLFEVFVSLFLCFFVLGTSIGELLLSVQLFPTQAQFVFHWYYSNVYWEPFPRTELPNWSLSVLLCTGVASP